MWQMYGSAEVQTQQEQKNTFCKTQARFLKSLNFRQHRDVSKNKRCGNSGIVFRYLRQYFLFAIVCLCAILSVNKIAQKTF